MYADAGLPSHKLHILSGRTFSILAYPQIVTLSYTSSWDQHQVRHLNGFPPSRVALDTLMFLSPIIPLQVHISRQTLESVWTHVLQVTYDTSSNGEEIYLGDWCLTVQARFWDTVARYTDQQDTM